MSDKPTTRLRCDRLEPNEIKIQQTVAATTSAKGANTTY